MKLRGLRANSYIHVSVSDIFPRSICLLGCRPRGGPIGSWEYVNPSPIHECGNWDWGRAVSFLEVHKSDFLCSAWKPSFTSNMAITMDSMGGAEVHTWGDPETLKTRHGVLCLYKQYFQNMMGLAEDFTGYKSFWSPCLSQDSHGG